ncbi:unnamed protein product [Moneuplotes crassus]|uniref:5-formyltetrahydrofolate cyclo-ligase n=1 Tax=Euplotes crassus TaxID=5936 RepID=A0AAD2D438_EUPCR|nr:unnamed protein product [Moneuplotes crassus]
MEKSSTIVKDLIKVKAALRKSLRKDRKEFYTDDTRELFINQDTGYYSTQYSKAIIDLVNKHFDQDEITVAGFWPIRSNREVECDYLLRDLHLYSEKNSLGKSFKFCLPVVVSHGTPLIFREWTPETVLEDASFKTKIPPVDCPELIPDCIICPLLGFTPAGDRIGYGGGFYDRTITKILKSADKLLTVGVAFEVMKCTEIPHDTDDAKLDYVVTEKSVYDCANDLIQ